MQYIRSKSYYTAWIEEPDPFEKSTSTRKWRWTVRVWIQTLKDLHGEGEQPRGLAPDVTGGFVEWRVVQL